MHGGELKDILADRTAKTELDRLERQVAAVEPEFWTEAVRKPASAEATVGKDVIELTRLLSAHHPLEHLAVLRGLCRRALPIHFLEIEERLVLDRGMPVPFATRPIQKLFRATPHQPTLNRGHLLEGLAFTLFDYPAGGDIQIALDFRHRDRLDELSWGGSDRLPRIATIHPEQGGVEVGSVDGAGFFDVGPVAWDEEAVLSLLRQAASEAEVAVLPELSLPHPEALETALGEGPEKYPPLVVAGSAHRRERPSEGGREIRCNESRIYLDGACVAVARKNHPFATKAIGNRRFAQAMTEDITNEPKAITVLSGQHTRLAVVVCADLNDQRIPPMLVEAGVNLLLVPALTPDAGAFNGSICEVASRCQGVAAVVNARLTTTGDPFLIMAAVPRPTPANQSAIFRGPARKPPAELGVFDANMSLSQAIRWL